MTSNKNTRAPLVLVVDDELAVRTSLQRALTLEGFSVKTAPDGRAALAEIRETPPMIVVLDVTMPNLDGITLVKRLRADGNDLPICILSARDGVEDRVSGLQAGADDYLIKPFAIAELTARLHALLRRRGHNVSETVHIGDIIVDARRHIATRSGRDLELTRREFNLLEVFARHPGQALTREQILEHVWGYTFDVDTNVADVFVSYLRRKLEANGEPRVLHTVRGIGWKFRP